LRPELPCLFREHRFEFLKPRKRPQIGRIEARTLLFRLQPPGKGAALAPARRGEHQSGRLGETSIPGDGHQSAGCTLVAWSPEGQELPKFSDALRRLGNRAPGAVLVVGLATTTDYPLSVDEFNTDDYEAALQCGTLAEVEGMP
jgi:hypothetical protein